MCASTVDAMIPRALPDVVENKPHKHAVPVSYTHLHITKTKTNGVGTINADSTYPIHRRVLPSPRTRVSRIIPSQFLAALQTFEDMNVDDIEGAGGEKNAGGGGVGGVVSKALNARFGNAAVETPKHSEEQSPSYQVRVCVCIVAACFVRMNLGVFVCFRVRVRVCARVRLMCSLTYQHTTSAVTEVPTERVWRRRMDYIISSSSTQLTPPVVFLPQFNLN